MAKQLVIHLLIPATSGKGTINTPPVMLNGVNIPLSTGGNFEVLCNPKIIMDGALNRATDCPWGVTCPDCRNHADWTKHDRPDPRGIPAMVPRTEPEGCCG